MKKYVRNEQLIASFGKHVKRMREERGLTQEELAFSMNMEISQVSRVERGVINTSISMAYEIAKAMNVPFHEFLNFGFEE